MNKHELEQLAVETEQDIKDIHQSINGLAEYNQERVLRAFRNQQVSDSHFNPTTGYGYDDMGRDKLEQVYAEVFGGEDALVRPQIVSGTHAITISLFGLLRPGNELLYITGAPYDTLEEIVGVRGSGNGSLKDFHIGYNQVNLLNNGSVNYEEVQRAITPHTKVIGIQRSKGYAARPSFTIAEIKEMIEYVKGINPEIIVFVDNCYGEFAEEQEPIHVGADLIAGSLIKNPGGGLARTGGYIAGRADLVEQCAYRLTAPGLGKETGATLHSLQEMYQGLFLAPHVVGEAMKGAVFTSRFLEKLGFATTPHYLAKRTDLIQSVTFETAEQMIAFCQEIQKASPINSHVTPYPSYMPGYEHDVIMAAGTFVQGGSLELTADGPIRAPYTAFVQGGLTYAHVKIAIKMAVERLVALT
ncbi:MULTISPECIES: aminotransferase class I/II-fold pyridoxal phosphate-dependent enzyme [Pontibacillus]|uniref:Methionine gamma-lyase family protein n=1 Tax=Pontibacillus chungwhensis TaxID=265426 RepID=A0ABY8V654_9BACI|nr:MULTISPECIES: methionine gamma-lyase family protein [Pontibacillus]MCD5322774.1 methionine gamma-lyase family protein [Pontibacillus sp. HN14]WIG00045.1 methionine gamma-lyase family protein [Pontibacillus chungwhensis]